MSDPVDSGAPFPGLDKCRCCRQWRTTRFLRQDGAHWVCQSKAACLMHGGLQPPLSYPPLSTSTGAEAAR